MFNDCTQYPCKWSSSRPYQVLSPKPRNSIQLQFCIRHFYETRQRGRYHGNVDIEGTNCNGLFIETDSVEEVTGAWAHAVYSVGLW